MVRSTARCDAWWAAVNPAIGAFVPVSAGPAISSDVAVRPPTKVAQAPAVIRDLIGGCYTRTGVHSDWGQTLMMDRSGVRPR